jgi:hypothetical protein
MATNNTSFVRLQPKQDKFTHTISVNDKAATRESIINQVRSYGHEFVARSDWNAKPYIQNGQHRETLSIDWEYTQIVIHHAGRSYSCGVGSFQLHDIENEHMNGPIKTAAVGYHYALDCSGTVFEGRDIRFKGASVKGYNTGVIGIVLLENLTSSTETIGSIFATTVNKVPEAQKNSANALIKALNSHFHISVLGGHREFPNQATEGKICPGNIGISFVNELRTKFGFRRP